MLLLDADGHPLRRAIGFLLEYRRVERPKPGGELADAVSDREIEIETEDDHDSDSLD